MVCLKGQLDLCKGRVCDTIQEMMDPSAGVVGGIVGLLCQGQHRLICSLVAFNVCGKCEPTRKVLYNFLQAAQNSEQILNLST